MNKKVMDQFVKLEQESKTIKFRLKPQGKTAEILQEAHSLKNDKERVKAYSIVKAMLDRGHRQLIQNTLEQESRSATISWEALVQAYMKSDKSPSDKKAKEGWIKEQDRKRKEISKLFTDKKEYKNLDGKNPFDVKNSMNLLTVAQTEEERKAVKSFSGFSVYWKNYYENRKHIYSEEKKSGTIAYRMIDENFIYYMTDYIRFNHIKEKDNVFWKEISEKWLEESDLPIMEIFSFEGYRYFLSQMGIDLFNRFVAFYNLEANLYYQKRGNGLDAAHPFHKARNRKLIPLYKQILSIAERRFEIPAFHSDEEVLNAVSLIKEYVIESKLQEKSIALFGDKEENNGEYCIKNQSLTTVSYTLYGKWNLLSDALRIFYLKNQKSSLSEQKKLDNVEKLMHQTNFTLSEVEDALKDYAEVIEENEELLNKIKNPFWCLCVQKVKELWMSFWEAEQKYMAFVSTWNKANNLKEEATTDIRDYLDKMNEIIRFLKLFQVSIEDFAQLDIAFYNQLGECIERAGVFIQTYNMTRNYITQKPYSEEKHLLKFDIPTLGDGWSVDKERDNGCLILRKNKKYYLAIMAAKHRMALESSATAEEESYEKMNYMLFKDISKMIPKCSTALNEVRSHMENELGEYCLDGSRFTKPLIITPEIYALSREEEGVGYKKWQKEYLRRTGNEEGHKAAVKKWIAFCFEFLQKYVSTADYDYSSLLPLEKYESVVDFYAEADKLLYRLDFGYIAKNKIDELVEEGKLFLFQIYNQDYSEHKRPESKKNLHTLYWEALFSEENAVHRIIKLNGGIEVFWRPSSIKKSVKHQAGEVLVNKRTKTGAPIPDDVYKELVEYFNGKSVELSDVAQKYETEVYTSQKKYEIIKDKRYTEEQYEVHIPLTLNFCGEKAAGINQRVLQVLHDNPEMNVIGLDRGERNLIAYAVVNSKGEILKQGTFNTVNQMNYQERLKQKEEIRQEERKSWKVVENIKELKEGYISQVVHELTEMMLEYNAVIAMEDLNFGFKKGRFKVERQVYQKFEMALLKKLHYLVTNKEEGEAMNQPGGTLCAYQLAEIPSSLKNIGKQSGFVFYVQPSYTSKIDPTTGFADIFDFSEITKTSARKAFFEKFDDIFYDEGLDMFAFSFNYGNFAVYQTFAKKDWVVYTNGERYVWDNRLRCSKLINLTEELKSLFDFWKIEWKAGTLKQILHEMPDTKEKAGFWNSLLYYFRVSLQLRSNLAGEQEDRIISPVKNEKGKFFATPAYAGMDFAQLHQYDSLPMDADTNGAYHIALKGHLMLEKVAMAEVTPQGKVVGEVLRISNPEWFAYRQK
ncbi:MAG: type V CRISPR-associated protein Cas12a/Cpf1 [Lachnospiraceae bacterium]|nr:type V CRISPR-associated protein Cas12a/Cpf1 [Lachnospiraceae bacterium]